MQYVFLWFLLLLVIFLFMAPMAFEIYSEQTRILMKIQMQMGMQAMGGAPDEPVGMRPFWDD